MLVKEKKLTSNVRSYNQAQELTGQFQIAVTANPSTSLNDVEKAIFEAFYKVRDRKIHREGPGENKGRDSKGIFTCR